VENNDIQAGIPPATKNEKRAAGGSVPAGGEAADEIRARLMALRDEKYRDFTIPLIPGVQPERIIGVRTPALRALAAELAGTAAAQDYIRALPHFYYEENNLHAFLVEKIKDFGACLAAVCDFLPYVDNWATCDSMSPKVFAKNTSALLPQSESWISSEKVFTVRYGIGTLMRYYLGAAFTPGCLELALSAKSGEYYADMMKAWFFATALAKRWDETLPYIEARRLDPWTHRKTIQKAVESYRISDEKKKYLRTLR
jgi:3-methyladenine DNA glycosylase AlkD